MLETTLSRAFVVGIITLAISSIGLYYLGNNPEVILRGATMTNGMEANYLGYYLIGSIILFIVSLILLSFSAMGWIWEGED